MALSPMFRRSFFIIDRRLIHQLITSKSIQRSRIHQIYITEQYGKYQAYFPKYFCLDNTKITKYEIDAATYHKVCEKTLESLCDHFEDLIDTTENLPNADVKYADGVLTVELGLLHGTYVINRQTPNKQIWLSSPISGPIRYDFIVQKPPDKGTWIYKHTGESLHKLLQKEFSVILRREPGFLKLPYAIA